MICLSQLCRPCGGLLRNSPCQQLSADAQEVTYEPGEELHASRSRASEEAAILLLVAGHIDTVLMPPARLSGRSSGTDSSLSKDDLFGGGSSANGDDFSLDGDVIGAERLVWHWPTAASRSCIYNQISCLLFVPTLRTSTEDVFACRLYVSGIHHEPVVGHAAAD